MTIYKNKQKKKTKKKQQKKQQQTNKKQTNKKEHTPKIRLDISFTLFTSDNSFFSSQKNTDSFLISSSKHMLLGEALLIFSYIFMKKYKRYYLMDTPLIWSCEVSLPWCTWCLCNYRKTTIFVSLNLLYEFCICREIAELSVFPESTQGHHYFFSPC